MSRDLPRVLGLGDATMLVVTSVIGVGIFFTPGAIAAALPHPALFLGAWVFGGALALAGALANAELGAMFPQAGGNYVYLREAYHPLAGFLVGWISIFAIFGGTVATLASGLAESVAAFVPMGAGGRLAVSAGAIVAVTAVNAASTRGSAAVSSATAWLKVVAIGALVGATVAFGHAPDALRAPEPAATVGFTQLGAAFSPVVFSYLGWNASVYMAGEIRDPARNVPRSLFLGLAACVALYLLVNTAYLRALGFPGLVGAKAAGYQAADAALGPRGKGALATLILVSVAGCLQANALVGPRIAYAMAKDGLFFSGVARLDARGVPSRAVLVQGATALGLVFVLRELPRLLDYTTFAIALVTVADTLALYVLRVRQPHRPRPYRALGYPVVPLLYVVANVVLATSMFVGRPVECLVSLGVIVLGLPAYAAFRSARTRRTTSSVAVGTASSEASDARSSDAPGANDA